MADSRAYWFVGASYSGSNDQTDRFIAEGIWQNGYENKYLDVVRSIKSGDKIAIKSSYVRKHHLPFDAKGQSVSVMCIKAIGIVTRNLGDGQTLEVDWDARMEPAKEWYFYTNRSTIWRVTANDWLTEGLIDFAFNNAEQDISRFRNAPYWSERYGDAETEKQRFKWTSFYEAIADKLVTYKNDRASLMKMIHELPNKIESISVLLDQPEKGVKEPLQDICPFTVFALFNRGITDANRKAIARELADFLDVDVPVPESFEGIPIVNNQRSWFFGYEFLRGDQDIDTLWELFSSAIEYANDTENDSIDALASAYNNATKCWGVGWNITMGLYWIRPWKYLTLDGQSQTYITRKLGLDIGLHGEKGRSSASDYFKLVTDLEARFQEDAYPVHSFPELSQAAYSYKVEAPVPTYDLDLDSDDEDFVEDESATVTKDVIPKFDELAVPLLQAVKDGETHLSRSVFERIKHDLDMEKYDTITLESTGKPLFDNRIAWAKSYLKRAGLLEFPLRAHMRITEKGLQFLEQPEDVLASYKVAADLIDQALEPVEEEAVFDPYSLDDIMNDGCFISHELLENMLERLRVKKNLILQGPPGTGKTWLAKKLAFALMGEKNDSKLRAVQFHPNLSYEDFVRGWRPSGDGKLSLCDGPFLEMINSAKKNAKTQYVLVIEEINRGNPAQIFGEMLTLLEADKRTPNEALELSYRRAVGERVYIPANLFVIGTMNIADRSLAMVDLALRRRFAFIDLKPVFGEAWRNWVHREAKIDMALLEEIESRMKALNDDIANDRNLGSQFMVGHSYVTPALKNTFSDGAKWFKSVVETEIGPLLDEYWFDDLDRARKARESLVEGL